MHENQSIAFASCMHAILRVTLQQVTVLLSGGGPSASIRSYNIVTTYRMRPDPSKRRRSSTRKRTRRPEPVRGFVFTVFSSRTTRWYRPISVSRSALLRLRIVTWTSGNGFRSTNRSTARIPCSAAHEFKHAVFKNDIAIVSRFPYEIMHPKQYRGRCRHLRTITPGFRKFKRSF